MMSNVKTHPLARLAPSLTDIAFMLPVVLLFTSWRTLQRAAVNFSSLFPRTRRLPAEDRQQHDKSCATVFLKRVESGPPRNSQPGSAFVHKTGFSLFRPGGEKNAQWPTWMNKGSKVLGKVGDEITVTDRPWRVHVTEIETAFLVRTMISGYAQLLKLRAEYDSRRYPVQVDFYGGRFVRNFLDISGVKYDWQSWVAVKQPAPWKPVYDDGTAMLIEPASSLNEIPTKSGNEEGAAPFQSGMARVEKLSFKRIKQ
jgi:hypothetical protein